MSTQQKLNFRLFLTLLRQLKGFGLNPHDWRIDRTNHLNEIQMYNRFDDEFRFRGHVSRTERGDYLLQNLKLASL